MCVRRYELGVGGRRVGVPGTHSYSCFLVSLVLLVMMMSVLLNLTTHTLYTEGSACWFSFLKYFTLSYLQAVSTLFPSLCTVPIPSTPHVSWLDKIQFLRQTELECSLSPPFSSSPVLNSSLLFAPKMLWHLFLYSQNKYWVTNNLNMETRFLLS